MSYKYSKIALESSDLLNRHDEYKNVREFLDLINNRYECLKKLEVEVLIYSKLGYISLYKGKQSLLKNRLILDSIVKDYDDPVYTESTGLKIYLED